MVILRGHISGVADIPNACATLWLASEIFEFEGMPATQRKAHAINVRSAHEPKLSSARHEAGGGCCSKGKQKRSTLTLPEGGKAFPQKRPWMISH